MREFVITPSEMEGLAYAEQTAFRLYVLLRSSDTASFGRLYPQFVRDLARAPEAGRPSKFELQRALHSLWRLGVVSLERSGLMGVVARFPLGSGYCVVFDLGGTWVDKGPDVPLSRPPTPKRIRDAVFQRDGRVCAKCGRTESPTIDHIKPVSRGGSDDLSNLRVLCRSCNCRKHAKNEK